jgi:hypothetical protein
VAKNLLITKDTALFKGLNRMVQYGDFTAKAVLYDHLKAKGGMSEREILDVISEEFVNYNRLPGRGRERRQARHEESGYAHDSCVIIRTSIS